MAGAPKWKVYDANGKYQAACKEVEAAAAIVANIYGDGSSIRWGHTSKKDAAWIEGLDGDAGESYDAVARVAHYRVDRRPVRGVAQ